jgi:hypothetical protein
MYSPDQLAALPVRDNPNFSLAPSGLSQNVATIPVSAPLAGSAPNPSRSNSVFSLPAAKISDTVAWTVNSTEPAPLEFVPASLNEVLIFDLTPNGVRQRWERVSLTTGEAGLTGMRVPLTTGVNSNDLFGSLTYYFDNQQVLQRIGFRGWTGNPQSLIDLVTQRFSFKKQATSAAGLYVAKSWGQSTGVLYLQYANVMNSSNPNQHIAVMLEVNNPRSSSKLSAEVSSVVFGPGR